MRRDDVQAGGVVRIGELATCQVRVRRVRLGADVRHRRRRIHRLHQRVLLGLQGLFLDPAQLNGRFRLSLGIGRFLDPDTASPLLLAVVGRVDLITIWITVLIAIGLCVTGRIPLRKAAIAAAIVWLVGGLPLIIPALRAM